MEQFNIKCNNEKEIKHVQLYLFNKNYEWLDSKKEFFFPENLYPIYIISHSEPYKFIWSLYPDKKIKKTYGYDYELSIIRRKKLLKLKNQNILTFIQNKCIK